MNLTQKHIAWLWIQLTTIYGQLFINKHGTQDTQGIWFETLKDLTPKALESGMERLKKLSAGEKYCEYPPNCLQFRALCLGFYDELRLPSVAEAYNEVQSRTHMSSNNWSHPIVKFTAKRLGKDFLKLDNPRESYLLFKRIYEQVCLLVQQGHEIPEIIEPIMLPKKSNPNIAKQHLHQIKLLIGATL